VVFVQTIPTIHGIQLIFRHFAFSFGFIEKILRDILRRGAVAIFMALQR
jgi:hypothetical protein